MVLLSRAKRKCRVQLRQASCYFAPMFATRSRACSRLLLAALLFSSPALAVELLFVGDVNFSSRREPVVLDAKSNPLAAFAERFRAADLAVANGEGLLTATRPAAYAEQRMDIGASPRWAPAFRAAGLDLVGLANNHSWDGGAEGLLESRRAISATGIAVYGAGATPEEAEAPYRLDGEAGCVVLIPASLKSNRPPRRGAAAAYYAGAGGLDRLLKRVSRHAKEGCFVVVSVHWGREGVHQPPGEVVRAAHALVDAGARLVVGHHPHVLQGVEFRTVPGCTGPCRAAIAYSLGNFVFWNRDPRKRESGVLRVTLGRGGLESVSLLPVILDPRDCVPRDATPAQARDLTARVADYSAPFGTRVTLEEGRIVFRDAP